MTPDEEDSLRALYDARMEALDRKVNALRTKFRRSQRGESSAEVIAEHRTAYELCEIERAQERLSIQLACPHSRWRESLWRNRQYGMYTCSLCFLDISFKV